MTRKERRAAEHAARKSERKAGFPSTANTTTPDPVVESTESAVTTNHQPAHPYGDPNTIISNGLHCGACTGDLDDQPAPKRELSEARLEANRKSAQASTGPTSPEGKAKVALNAVKTGLTGRTVLLPFDNVTAYQALLTSWLAEFNPLGPIEKGLVQSLVDTCWRLERIPGLEYALIEYEHNKLGFENAYVASTTPQMTLELHIRQVHEKDFRNLHLQEMRLMRRRERELKELRALQAARKAKEEEELKTAAQAALVAEHQNQSFQVSQLGFVFTTQRFMQYMARLTPSMKQNLLKEALVGTSETIKAAA